MSEAGRDGRRAGIRARLPHLLGLALFVLALVALRHLLDEIDPARLAAELRAMPPWRIGLAMLFSALGYVALAGYDWSALAYVGKRLPLATVVPGGMVAYAVSNSVGFAALSGTAIRWRLYRPLGLEARDLAVMAAFMSAAFVVAGCLIGFAALAIRPEALAHLVTLPPGQVRALSLLAIAAIVVPLARASRSGHALGVRGRAIRVPPPALLLRQLAISTADIGLAALTLWILLPAAGVGPFTFAAVYAVALLAGVLSGVPGGIGVFETVLLAGLPDTVGTERLAAALLLYRLVYYFLPLFAALLFLGWQEARRRSLGGRVSGRAAELAGTVAPLVPPILAAVLLGAGLWLNLFAVIPAPAALADGGAALLSAAGLEAATLSMSILGVGLVILALGVRRRRRAAYWLAIAALLAGALLLALKMHHPLHAIGFAGLALALLPFRPMFHRPSLLGALTLQPGWLALVAGFLGLVLLALFLAHRETPYAAELWWQFAADAHAPRALRAAFASALLLSAASLALLLKAPPLRPTAPGPEALTRAEAIARAGDDPDAAFALMGDKALLFAPDDEAFVMYAVSGRSWIALYGPVGPPEPAAEAAFRFVDAARQAGDWPVFYEVAERDVPLMLELGLVLYKMGEEAVVELAGFGLEGPARRKLRMAHGRGVRAGLAFEVARPPHPPALMAELSQVSDAWLAQRAGAEKGFSVGRFDEAWLQRWPLALVRAADGSVVAFANLLITDRMAMATVDLMRHRADPPPATMDFLFCELMLRLKAEGFERFSLGMAPLSGIRPERSGRLWDRAAAMLFRHGERFYGFAGLRAWKSKFDPQWRPRWLAIPPMVPPVLPLADAARLIGGHLPGVDRAAAGRPALSPPASSRSG